jgi:hypothetical protein
MPSAKIASNAISQELTVGRQVRRVFTTDFTDLNGFYGRDFRVGFDWYAVKLILADEVLNVVAARRRKNH